MKDVNKYNAPVKVNIVFLPGLDGTGISFEPIAALLPPSMAATVIRYPNEKLSFEETVSCAAAQFPLVDDAIVIAESFSGPVAIELLGSGRVKAKGLVLVATFACSPRPTLLPLCCSLPLDLLLGLPVPNVFLKYLFGSGEAMKEFMPMWKRIKVAVSPAILAHRLRVVRSVDVTRRLPTLSLPCCYIQAENDVVIPSKMVNDLLKAQPNLLIRKIQGPHFILQAQPERSLAVIEEFSRLITTGC